MRPDHHHQHHQTTQPPSSNKPTVRTLTSVTFLTGLRLLSFIPPARRLTASAGTAVEVEEEEGEEEEGEEEEEEGEE